ncbi:MAG: ATP-binding protein [Christensenellales bacterium]
MRRNDRIREILRSMEQERLMAEADAYRAKQAFLAAHPELLAARRAMASAYASAARSAAGEAQRTAAGEAEDAYHRLFTEVCEREGVTADSFAPGVRCPRCGDTGRLPEGGLCGCVSNRLAAEARQTYSVDGEKTFSAFSEDIFDDDVKIRLSKTAALTQRELMRRVRDFCRGLCEAFPEGVIKSLVLEGGAGLGKTFLLHCMANAFIDKSVAVVLCDSYGINQAALDREDGERLDSLWTVPVLLVDDLGAEPLLQKITGETLFTLLNRRQNDGLTTVFSTNLTRDELRERYGERFTSRLGDRETARWLRLEGSDIRRRG